VAETLPGEPWDVVVIGAGPAGALASLDLARRGLRVLLVEKRRFPRWKVCGTCFNSQAQAALASVGQGQLLESLGGLPLRRLRLGLGGRQATCALPPGWALSRSRFDQALVEAAVSAGVVFRPRTTAQLGPASAQARSVSLCQGRHQELVRAAVVLVAAGLAHRCLENEPTAQTRISPRSRVGAGCVLAGVEHQHPWEEGTIHMAVGRQGYVGLALEVARRALADAGLAPERITQLVTVCCTGFQSPGFDLALMNKLPLSPDMERTHVGFMGCHGALNGLRVARAFVEADPGACVLLCAVELCSLHMHYGWDPEKLVANALFADGPRILAAVAAAAELDPSQIEPSAAVLRQFGNMSSPTILFILERLRRAAAPRPWVALAFGPGLTVEASLLG
jgi:hypothetical protein